MPDPNNKYLATIQPQSTIQSAWGNAIADRVVLHFDSRNARDNQTLATCIPTAKLKPGMVSYLEDEQKAEWWVNSTIGWAPGPWNAPWGEAALLKIAGPDTPYAAGQYAIPGLNATIGVWGHRRYRVVFQVLLQQKDTTGNQRVGIRVTPPPDGSEDHFRYVSWEDSIPTDAYRMHSGTFVLGYETNATRLFEVVVDQGPGSGVVVTTGAIGFLLIEDIGNYGTPVA